MTEAGLALSKLVSPQDALRQSIDNLKRKGFAVC